MSIETLLEVCPPPAKPRWNTGDWKRVLEAFGTIPPDFRAMIGRYGSGVIGGRVTVFNPFDPSPSTELVSAAARILETLRATRHDSPDDFQFPLYPEPGGILPWAITDTGATLCWMEAGAPDAWPIVAIPALQLTGETFDVNATAFLAGWLSGTIQPTALDPPRYRRFEPPLAS